MRIALLALLTTAVAYGQGNMKSVDKSTTTQVEAPVLHKGYYVSLNKMTDADIDARAVSQSGGSGSFDDIPFNHVMGVAAGYTLIRQGALGFSTELSYDIYESGEGADEVEFKGIRANGNATWGINDEVHFFAGLNMNRLMSGPGLGSTKFKPGYQIGANLKLDNYGIQINYNHIAIDSDADGIDLRGEIRALGLTGVYYY